jgi:hypothetical protein
MRKNDTNHAEESGRSCGRNTANMLMFFLIVGGAEIQKISRALFKLGK